MKDEVVVEHIVGANAGDPMRLPSICYRTREEAWGIIMDFMSFGKKSDKFEWISLDDIDYKGESF